MSGSGMHCEDARLRIGAEPLAQDVVVDQHVAQCADCAGFRREMRELEGHIVHAMQQTPGLDSALVPVGGPRREAARAENPRTRSRMPLALAAGVAFLAFAVGALFLARPETALASALVEHMAGEPESWEAQRPMPQSALDLVLARSGVRLDRARAGEIVYANSCYFRGRYVPHLVVQTGRGPATVLVLAGERVETRRTFSADGYSGVIIPAADGTTSLAVVIRAGDAAAPDPDDVARRFAAAMPRN